MTHHKEKSLPLHLLLMSMITKVATWHVKKVGHTDNTHDPEVTKSKCCLVMLDESKRANNKPPNW